jgi:hypothetical protein
LLIMEVSTNKGDFLKISKMLHSLWLTTQNSSARGSCDAGLISAG